MAVTMKDSAGVREVWKNWTRMGRALFKAKLDSTIVACGGAERGTDEDRECCGGDRSQWDGPPVPATAPERFFWRDQNCRRQPGPTHISIKRACERTRARASVSAYFVEMYVRVCRI